MKSLLFSLLSVLLYYSAASQCTQPVIGPSNNVIICSGSSTTLSASVPGGGWTSIKPFGGTGRNGAVAFSIGSKGYVGTGSDGSNDLKDFWEYDPSTGAWTQKADFGGGARSGAVAFSIGTKGYVGTGSDTKDFWEYDPATNIWTRKADFGGEGRSNATGFSIGNKGYIGTGDGGAFDFKNDFWQYDPASNTWIQKASISPLSGATGFSIGNKGYLGTGEYRLQRVGSFSSSGFSEYDPATDSWTQKAYFPGNGRIAAVSFSLGSKGYLTSGFTETSDVPSYNPSSDFWQYDPATDSWTQGPNLLYASSYGAVAFSIGNNGYVGLGNEQTTFEKFTPSLSYRWSPGGDTTSSITVNKAGKYTVTVTDGNGCTATSTPVYVSVHSSTDNKLYVDASVTKPGDGSSWKTAIKEFRDALKTANECSGIDSILVAKGIYRPTKGTNRDSTFAITRSGLKLYGGYPSGGGERDIKTNATVLSGDIGVKGTDADNSYHVMVIAGLPYSSATVVIDGFKIKDGYADDYTSSVINEQSIIRRYGAGVCLINNECNISINNCFITQNNSFAGGGVYNEESGILFENSSFVSNKSTTGGGIYTYGGALLDAYSEFHNCVFYNNQASNEGGAVYGAESGNNIIYNCTLVKNNAKYSGGAVGYIYGGTRVTLANSILWNNEAQGPPNIRPSDNVVLHNCIIQGGYSGSADNIITKAPRFANINNLLGPDRILGTTDDGLQLQAQSPAINAGDNFFVNNGGLSVITTDITGSPRVVDSVVDIGAYEYRCGTNNNLTALQTNTIQNSFDKVEPSVNLYPNPAVEIAVLTLSDLGKNATVTVTDLSGKILWKKENVTDRNLRIPVANFTSGTYLVTVRSDTFTKTLKLIKQ